MKLGKRRRAELQDAAVYNYLASLLEPCPYCGRPTARPDGYCSDNHKGLDREGRP